MIDNNATLMGLEELKLQGMTESFRASLQLASHNIPTAHELLAQLVQNERLHRTGKLTEIYLKMSNLRYDAMHEQVECSSSRNLSKDQLQRRITKKEKQKQKYIYCFSNNFLLIKVAQFSPESVAQFNRNSH
jgi:hypothetical protein